jgi:hypothetical protein
MAIPAIALATVSIATPAVAYASTAMAQAGPSRIRTAAQPDRIPTHVNIQRDDDAGDISGLLHQSPVCSALDTETIPTGDVVARCLIGTHVI